MSGARLPYLLMPMSQSSRPASCYGHSQQGNATHQELDCSLHAVVLLAIRGHFWQVAEAAAGAELAAAARLDAAKAEREEVLHSRKAGSAVDSSDAHSHAQKQHTTSTARRPAGRQCLGCCQGEVQGVKAQAGRQVVKAWL